MNDRSSHDTVLAFIGHLALVLAIIADNYRRSSEGWISVALSATSLFLLMGGAFFFVRHPRLFFFVSDKKSAAVGKLSQTVRLLTWLLVIVPPVLWIIAIVKIQELTPMVLGIRFAGSYVFFAWIFASIVVWPILFGRRR